MLVIPALHLEKGRCVSRYKAYENEQKSVFSGDPVKKARTFFQNNARHLHIVDLDAHSKLPKNNDQLLFEIKAKFPELQIMYSGGVTDMNRLEKLISQKIDRIVLGPQAESLIKHAINVYGPEKICGGILSRAGYVKHGASDKTRQTEILHFAESLVEKGVSTIIFTDLDSVGTLFPHFDDTDRLITFFPTISVYHAGGISRPEQLSLLKKIGCQAAIINKAFHEGQLSLENLRRW